MAANLTASNSNDINKCIITTLVICHSLSVLSLVVSNNIYECVDCKYHLEVLQSFTRIGPLHKHVHVSLQLPETFSEKAASHLQLFIVNTTLILVSNIVLRLNSLYLFILIGGVICNAFTTGLLTVRIDKMAYSSSDTDKYSTTCHIRTCDIRILPYPDVSPN